MSELKIYHNPRCRKSRETLKLITEKGLEPEVILYLQNPPGEQELTRIIDLLGIDPTALIRKGESIFKENFKGKELSADEWIKIMVENPKLIERPIVVKGDQAIIGRPPENVQKLL